MIGARSLRDLNHGGTAIEWIRAGGAVGGETSASPAHPARNNQSKKLKQLNYLGYVIRAGFFVRVST